MLPPLVSWENSGPSGKFKNVMAGRIGKIYRHRVFLQSQNTGEEESSQEINTAAK